MEMKIRITDEQLVKQMDEVIKEEGFTSRNQFITYVISMYLTSENKFFLRAFSPVMREICKESIDEQKKNTEHLLQKNEIIMQDMLRTMNDIRAVFYSEITENETKENDKKNRI